MPFPITSKGKSKKSHPQKEVAPFILQKPERSF
ncbi:MAG: hypothetical protein ACI956_001012 [Nonlabens sp.]